MLLALLIIFIVVPIVSSINRKKVLCFLGLNNISAVLPLSMNKEYNKALGCEEICIVQLFIQKLALVGCIIYVIIASILSQNIVAIIMLMIFFGIFIISMIELVLIPGFFDIVRIIKIIRSQRFTQQQCLTIFLASPDLLLLACCISLILI